MKSAALGRSTSQVEVTNVSPHGFWLFVGEHELFVSFEDFPWFKEASIRQIARVELPSAHHLYWPDLDVDLSIDSILDPRRFPLVSRERPRQAYSGKAGRAPTTPTRARRKAGGR